MSAICILFVSFLTKAYLCLLLVFHVFHVSINRSLLSLLIGILTATDDPGEEMGPVQKG